MNKRFGLFITIDGPSGVGKTTVGGIVSGQLRSEGVAVTLTTTPSSSEMGRLARTGTYRIQGTALACLVAADRYHHYSHIVAPALLRGEVVLCDRYVPSSLVLDVLDGVERDFAWNLYKRIAIPDMAVILIGDPAVCNERCKARQMYSRFHPRSVEGNVQEMNEYLAAIAYLQNMQYPVHVQPVENLDASQIAQILLDTIHDTWRGER
jgi:dTMP kinase